MECQEDLRKGYHQRLKDEALVGQRLELSVLRAIRWRTGKYATLQQSSYNRLVEELCKEIESGRVTVEGIGAENGMTVLRGGCKHA